MNILVTGGAGYVGSHCVRALCNAGHRATVLDNLSQGHRAAVDPRARFIHGDLAHPALLRETLSSGRFDAVLHFAAHLDVGESVRDPLKYYRNNVANSVALLHAMHAAGIQRMVFSSTCATYGQPDEMPLTEDTPQQPINPYGRTKLAVEWAMRDSADAWGLGGCALRYFNASGAATDGTLGEDHDPEIHLVPIVLQVALGRRESVRVFGTDYPTSDGTCIRDYVHVEDLADAHVRAIESQPASTFRAYNVGTGRGTSVREVIAAARDATGHPIPSVDAPRRPGDPPRLYADASKIKRELDWTPRFADIRPIIETAWTWHQTHPDGYPAG
ncbi:MAG: UDP-glucose 4-epimerase GalE [Phycisphaerales bacterium]|nr:UDP-glucose 4-epimerase GalE [Phycisphaerales bacterium]